jgi:DNA mismatch endonuclease (patch repair protein)
MPRESTGPELAIRRELHRCGLRFTLQRRDLPGTPDIAFTRAKVAVFVDGCFWHGCPDHSSVPKTNTEWWVAKFAANIERDHRKDGELIELGWYPVHVWEHEPAAEAASRIKEVWAERIVTNGATRSSV